MLAELFEANLSATVHVNSLEARRVKELLSHRAGWVQISVE